MENNTLAPLPETGISIGDNVIVELAVAPAALPADLPVREETAEFYIYVYKRLLRGATVGQLATEFVANRDSVTRWNRRGETAHRLRMDTQAKVVLDRIKAGLVRPPIIIKETYDVDIEKTNLTLIALCAKLEERAKRVIQ